MDMQVKRREGGKSGKKYRFANKIERERKRCKKEGSKRVRREREDMQAREEGSGWGSCIHDDNNRGRLQ